MCTAPVFCAGRVLHWPLIFLHGLVHKQKMAVRLGGHFARFMGY